MAVTLGKVPGRLQLGIWQAEYHLLGS